MSEVMNTAWQPSKRLERGGAAEQVLADVREQILNGRIPRGAKLPTEKQLADSYGVSGATIREAVRGLATLQLIEVRHGSGAYVTAEADRLVALPLQALIQLEGTNIAQVLSVLGALNSHAAELAATHASEEQILTMRRALEAVDHGESIEEIVGGLTLFVGTLAQASANPLLAALCRFLGGVQIDLARQLAAGRLDVWREIAGQLRQERRDLFGAVAARNLSAARLATLAYHARALTVISAMPNAGLVAVADPEMSSFLGALLQQSAE